MKTNFTKLMIALVSMAVMTVGCKKPAEEVRIPTVVMLEDSIVITHNSALLYAQVTDKGGAEVMGRGFCFATTGGAADTLFSDGSGALFSLTLTGLTPATSYTCRAFADNDAGRGFSEAFRFTTQEEPAPVVKTYFPTEITYATALAAGCVASDGGQEVRERGICYGTNENPTINGLHIASGSGLGQFECMLTDLSANTKYNIRAYAVCSEGIYYGNEQYFWTSVLPMEVRTLAVSDVTASRVRADGKVVRDGGYEVTEYGFCWSTEHLPTIEGYHVWAGVGTGDYSQYFSGLERGVTHYVRAYAINENGVAYGEELEFVPDDPFPSNPDGALSGLFSISADQQVRFSKGNLQYRPARFVWRFAEHQWDYVGGEVYEDGLDCNHSMGTVYEDEVQCSNSLVSREYDGWVDIFGWGTSGWDNGNVYYRPYEFASHVYECAFYGPPGNFDLTGDYAQADWGVYNTISNGGSRQWRTPTADEYRYILEERVTPSGMRFAKAQVAGVRGLILLPDDWSASTYYLRSVNVNIDYFVNKISGMEWLDILEPAGAVFLPASGYRYQNCYWNSEWNSFYCDGNYWTTTQGVGVDYASHMFFYGSQEGGYTSIMISDMSYRCFGEAVRLISEER